jgi:hypothetical protein
MSSNRASLSSPLLAAAAVAIVTLASTGARADVVVNGTQQPAPAPVVVEPVPAPVAQPAPVVVPPAPAPVVEPAPRRTTVVEHENHNYMSTIAVSALMGGVAGVLVGGAIYYLADNQTHPGRILYWGAGGVLVGGAVGVTQLIVQESRVDRATASNLPTDPARRCGSRCTSSTFRRSLAARSPSVAGRPAETPVAAQTVLALALTNARQASWALRNSRQPASPPDASMRPTLAR